LTKRSTIAIIFFIVTFFLFAIEPLTQQTQSPKLPRPIFISDSGRYFDFVIIAFRVAEPDIIIRYSIDNSPVDENSLVYSSPFTKKIDTIIRAKAYKDGFEPSDEIIQEFIIQNVPQISKTVYTDGYIHLSWFPSRSIANTEWVPKYYEDIEYEQPMDPIPVFEERLVFPGNKVNQRLNINDPDNYNLNNNIKYDVFIASSDSSTISLDSLSFYKANATALTENTFSIPATEPGFYYIFVQAVCELIKETNLSNTSEIHMFNLQQVNDFTITPPPGLYYDVTRVSLSHPFAKIYYTLDGNPPDETAKVFTTPIILNKKTTTNIMYRGYADGYVPSEVMDAQYRITDTVTPPIFSHHSGLYAQPFYLSLFCDIENALIFYTLDGSDPYRYSQIYVNPILIDRTMTVKAEATLSTWKRSGVYTVDFEIYNPNLISPQASNETRLLKAQPNPFETYINISFIMQNDGYVEMMVYNLLGQKVVTLISTMQKRGEHAVSWDGKNTYGESVSSGVYFCHFKTGDYFEVVKIIYSGSGT